MTDPFERAFAIVVGIEAGYSDDPADRGNWTSGKVGVGELKGTKFGISAAAFPHLDIKSLTLSQARDIYRGRYWDRNRCGEMPWCWALGVFDGEVVQGTGLEIAQRTLRLKDDGYCGPVTLAAMQRASEGHFRRFMAARGVAFTKANQWEHDGLGWVDRLLNIHHLAMS